MNGLDLFSGIGGIGIALEPWVRTVAYCERDRYAQGVLLSRMRSCEIDTAPIWDDVTTLRGDMLPRIDIIFGGFPCQDLSVAGRGAGLDGERSGLFFEIARLVRECEPRFVFLENVPAIRTRGGERVVKELASIGYDCRWTTLSAASVRAPHKRDRWFLLAYSKRELIRVKQRWSIGESGKGSPLFRDNGEKKFMAHASGIRSERPGMANESGEGRQFTESSTTPEFNWSTEPDVGRVVNGLQNRMDRIRCLGNSVVPLQVRTAFQKLAGLKI